MNTDIVSMATAEFCALSPTLLVWLGGALLCAYMTDRAPVRFIALGILLGMMVVASVSLPFMRYMALSMSMGGQTSIASYGVMMGITGALGTVLISVIPPVAVVLIGLLTASPPEDA